MIDRIKGFFSPKPDPMTVMARRLAAGASIASISLHERLSAAFEIVSAIDIDEWRTVHVASGAYVALLRLNSVNVSDEAKEQLARLVLDGVTARCPSAQDLYFECRDFMDRAALSSHLLGDGLSDLGGLDVALGSWMIKKLLKRDTLSKTEEEIGLILGGASALTFLGWWEK